MTSQPVDAPQHTLILLHFNRCNDPRDVTCCDDTCTGMHYYVIGLLTFS